MIKYKLNICETSMIRRLAKHSSAEHVEADAERVEVDAERVEVDAERVEVDAERVEVHAEMNILHHAVPPPLAGQAIPIDHRDRL